MQLRSAPCGLRPRSLLHARPVHAASRARRVGCQASEAAAPAASPPGDLAAALLLPYFGGALNRSQFAAQCFVESVAHCYVQGMPVDELQMALQLKNLQCSPPLLAPLEQDTLLSWMLVVMLTLAELGVPFPEGAAGGAEGAAPGAAGAAAPEDAAAGGDDAAWAITSRYTAEVEGLLGYVRQALDLHFRQGYTLQRLLDLQGAVNQGQEEVSQFAMLMQQYTRLVFVTLEVVAATRLPTSKPLASPASLVAGPSGYTSAFWPAAQLGAAAPPDQLQLRGQACRLLMAFHGAIANCSYSLAAFVEGVCSAYDAGYAAVEVFGALREEEFAQAGGLLPLPTVQPPQEVSRQLFGRWLSLAYITLAQLGVAFPGAGADWAWAGDGDAVEANGANTFVANVLQRRAQEASQQLDSVPEDQLAARIRASPEAAAALAAASQAAARELAETGRLRGKELPPLVRVSDDELGQTSPALAVWRQQIEVVEAAAAAVEAALAAQQLAAGAAAAGPQQPGGGGDGQGRQQPAAGGGGQRAAGL